MPARTPDDRDLAVYDGQTLIGTIAVHGRSHEALAANGSALGNFSNLKAARAAVSAAHNVAISTAEARRRLSEPIGFVSGLPANFLRVGR